jgi:hypothetical protein
VSQLASASLKTKVWVPDPFFANQREGHVLDNPADNTLFRISRNGDHCAFSINDHGQGLML